MLFNPIIETIISTYQYFWIVLFSVLVIDWSLGFDKISKKVDNFLIFLERFIEIETLFPLFALTFIACLSKIISIIVDSDFFHIFSSGSAIIAIGYLILNVVLILIIASLTALRKKCISYRNEKTDKKS